MPSKIVAKKAGPKKFTRKNDKKKPMREMRIGGANKVAMKRMRGGGANKVAMKRMRGGMGVKKKAPPMMANKGKMVRKMRGGGMNNKRK